MKKNLFAFLGMLAAFSAYGVLSAYGAQVERSPFTDVFYEGEYVKVEYQGVVYNLLELNGVRRSDLMTKCQELYFDSCQQRFAENLDSFMEDINLPLGETVKIKLYSMQTHAVKEEKAAPLAVENTEIILAKRRDRGDS